MVREPHKDKHSCKEESVICNLVPSLVSTIILFSTSFLAVVFLVNLVLVFF